MDVWNKKQLISAEGCLPDQSCLKLNHFSEICKNIPKYNLQLINSACTRFYSHKTSNKGFCRFCPSADLVSTLEPPVWASKETQKQHQSLLMWPNCILENRGRPNLKLEFLETSKDMQHQHMGRRWKKRKESRSGVKESRLLSQAQTPKTFDSPRSATTDVQVSNPTTPKLDSLVSRKGKRGTSESNCMWSQCSTSYIGLPHTSNQKRNKEIQWCPPHTR